MNAMMKAIMQRRAQRAGEMGDLEENKNSEMNPDEGSNDDLTIAKMQSEEGRDGLAPDVSDMDEMTEDGDGMMTEMDQEMPGMQQSQEGGMDEKIMAFFSPDDVGKPGIRGKAADKMKAALAKFKKS